MDDELAKAYEELEEDIGPRCGRIEDKSLMKHPAQHAPTLSDHPMDSRHLARAFDPQQKSMCGFCDDAEESL